MMVSCSKFAFLMTIYASYALLLAQAEDLRRLQYDSDQLEDINRPRRDDLTIRRDHDEYNSRSSSDIEGRRRLDDRIDQSRRLIREDVDQGEERRSMSEPTLPQSERLADNRRESTRYGSIERSFDRQVERLEDREDRTRSTVDSERLSVDRQVDRQVERLEDREDRIRSTVDSERRDGVFDRRESRRESREETSERRVTSRRESRGESEGESRREARREDRSEYRSEDRESRSEEDSRRQTRTQMGEDNVRAERLSRRSTERVENEDDQSDRRARREDVRDFRSTESNVALVESNSRITTFLGQMVSLIVTVMLVNKSTKGGFTSKVKQLFSNKVTVQ